ncbi:hypothetical protein V1264_000350 [Littorina saxatilis]|uniref:Integrase catalytic domain-containing protein n=1 Tax=Littorina saxatilis TaxID=31220 RepID=A0AAN9C4G5_9CAEN
MSPLPPGPWQEVSADFGHLPNGKHLLVVTDEYSRYPVVVINSTAARTVIPHLDKIFAEFGIPVLLKTDNGPPFNSHEFAAYATNTGFKHRKITPLWPRGNAETERFMRTIKKTIKAALALHHSYEQAMYQFLLDYRTTPHSTTGVPPATLIFSRTLKTRLPHIPESFRDDSALRQRDAAQKQNMKRHIFKPTCSNAIPKSGLRRRLLGQNVNQFD